MLLSNNFCKTDAKIRRERRSFAPFFYGQSAVFHVVVLLKIAAADLIYALGFVNEAEHVGKLILRIIGGIERTVERRRKFKKVPLCYHSRLRTHRITILL